MTKLIATIFKGLFLSCCLLGVAASEGIYKWVDGKGVTHYSESSPDNVPAREVEIEPPPAAESVEAAQQQLKQSAQDYQRRSEAYKAEKQRSQAAQHAREQSKKQKMEQCSVALVQLRVLEEMVPVYRDEKGIYHSQTSAHSAGYAGKRSYLNDEDRAMEIARFQQQVDANCAPGQEKGTALRERLIADYHERQCRAARRLLVELEQQRVDRRDEDIVAVMQDIDRHCHRPRR